MARELHVVFQKSGRAGHEVIVRTPVVRLGRALECEVLFDETADRVVSRHHGEIRWENDHPVLHPAKNKLILRAGQELAGPTPLANGDVLEFAGAGGPSIAVFFEPATRPLDLPTAMARLPSVPGGEPEIVNAVPGGSPTVGPSMLAPQPPRPPTRPAVPPAARGRPLAPTSPVAAASRSESLAAQPPAPVAPPAPPAQIAPVAPAKPASAKPAPAAAPLTAGGMTFTAGQVLNGRYRVEDKIGQGGMAAVFRVTDLELNEQVALKIFTKKVENDRIIARFKQELVLSRRLNHPGIVRLYDIGTLEGLRFITMELLSGTDLQRPPGEKFPFDDGLNYLIQACHALQHAHERGVIHRDIKPANLFLTKDGLVKLMDFGLAKNQTGPGLTVAGVTGGTPEYMSPEQISGFGTVTASTDLYALGIMAYRFFTGTVPFQHKEVIQLMFMHVRDAPRSPRELNPEIPEALERVILRLLEKEPANRYPDCKALAAELEKVRAALA